MTLREKIIVVLAGIALLYGAYELGLKNLFSGAGDKIAQTAAPRTDAGLSGFTMELAARTGHSGLSDREQYILDHRHSRWDTDPFVAPETLAAMRNPESGGTTSDSGQTRFVYSGYIAIGNVRLAVINGREYEEGERLVDGGYVLRRIQPTRVVLSGDGGGEVTVKLKEIDVKVE
ncbi:general secretion pathway protein GspB [Desulfosudis oleivorans]|uniref:Type II secretion system protein GspB C-terminal domain-containing protein n=1 Tax=Desulfosudis oleivorans (strain DSM 6200 / JCM 39069 / Hxd3) TaxID=96561 RepID=A8ZYV4_DESOH|nr:general secretion pathway protein GspB [Desulfosudis oleivorans]ABW67209.1 hypothetical protein Dole_1405 [Desulfosudis oleivorans Hxd3]